MYIGAVAVLPTYVDSRLLFSAGRAASDVDACPIFHSAGCSKTARAESRRCARWGTPPCSVRTTALTLALITVRRDVLRRGVHVFGRVSGPTSCVGSRGWLIVALVLCGADGTSRRPRATVTGRPRAARLGGWSGESSVVCGGGAARRSQLNPGRKGEGRGSGYFVGSSVRTAGRPGPGRV